MQFFKLKYRVDISYQGRAKSDMDVILAAETEDEARNSADAFVSNYGLYNPGMAGVTVLAGTKPRFVATCRRATGFPPTPVISIAPTWEGSDVQEPRSVNL
jgi:hypothetical protein